jgi:reductive dehalogenase
MLPEQAQDRLELAFPVPDYRFDQKNEMFKRGVWDEKVRSYSQRFSQEVGYKNRPGYRKLDYAFRNAAFNLERSFGFGNARGNSGLYAWEGVPDRIKRYVDSGGPVQGSREEMSRIIKKAARFLGADMVGVCRLHPNWVYSHEFNLTTKEHRLMEVPEGCDNAVVIAVEMDYAAMRSAPTGVASGATGLGYSRMASTANMLAVFIRGLGYRAIPCGNDTALSIPLAMAAGLGEYSRMGLLITERFGPRVRLCKVFTDLPLKHDTYSPLGVVGFCERCMKCVEHCPARAIPSGDMTTEGPNISNHSGVRKWYVDAEKCFSFWAKNRMDCTICISVCPFNKPAGQLHDAVRAVVRRTTIFNRLFAWMDDVLGYGKLQSAEKFWNP